MTRAKADAAEGTTTSPGSDFLALDITTAPPGRRSVWLADQLRLAISDGRLRLGSSLPPSRSLAQDLGVSRGVVTEAYQRLVEDGHAAGRGRSGTVVLAAPAAPPPAPMPTSLAAPAFPAPTSPDAFDVLRAAPARFDFSPGLPDLSTFPRTAWLRAERAVLSTMSARDLGYGDPAGAPPLREAVAVALARSRGIRVDPRRVVIVTGVAQALGLVAQVLHDSGVRDIAFEEPGSLGVRQHLEHWGLRTPPVPVDDRGLDVEALRATGAPAVLATPAHQFPTGVVLDGDRRRELTQWVRDGGLLVEDDYDAEHRYDRAPVPALRATLPDASFYTGSVSKVLAPALRTGWLLAPAAHHDAVVDAKRFADLGSATLPQLVLARLMESGELERHLRTVRRRHRQRRDAMVAAIARHLPRARISGAAAGLHLMLTLSRPDVDDRKIAAMALEHGVKVHPLSWHRQVPGPPGLVLGYAAQTPDAIQEGIAVLGRVAR